MWVAQGSCQIVELAWPPAGRWHRLVAPCAMLCYAMLCGTCTASSRHWSTLRMSVFAWLRPRISVRIDPPDFACDVGEGEGGQLRVPDYSGAATGAATVLTGFRWVQGQAASTQAMVGAGVQGSGLLSCGRFLLMLPWGEKRKGAAAALAPPLSGSFECRSMLISSSIL